LKICQRTTDSKIVILGVDPGFSISGYAVLGQQLQKVAMLDCGYLKMNSKHHLSERTHQFYNLMQNLITKHSVTHIALETSFLGKNPQTFLKLGFLRGVLYLLAAQKGLTISEFAPREIKQSVTGTGGASKEQVAYMLLKLFPQLESIIKKAVYADVTDAIAIAICGIWNSKTLAKSQEAAALR
jgi:crossover junction endodeoxyribonuclease RuvC